MGDHDGGRQDGGRGGVPADIDLFDVQSLIEAARPQTRTTLREFHRLLNVVLSSKTVKDDPVCAGLLERMLLAPSIEAIVPHLEALTTRLADLSVERTGTTGLRSASRIAATRATISGAEGLDEDRPRRTMLRL